MRAAILTLGHHGGARTQRLIQTCVACGVAITDPAVHAVLECEAHVAHRLSLRAVLGELGRPNQASLVRILTLQPGDVGFAEAVLLAHAIDNVANAYWQGRA